MRLDLFSVHLKLTALHPFHLGMIQFLWCQRSCLLGYTRFTVCYETEDISSGDNKLTKAAELLQINDTV